MKYIHIYSTWASFFIFINLRNFFLYSYYIVAKQVNNDKSLVNLKWTRYDCNKRPINNVSNLEIGQKLFFIYGKPIEGREGFISESTL